MNVSDLCGSSGCVKKFKFILIPKLRDLCLKSLTELNMSSRNISEVPDFIWNIVNVTKLDLSSNDLNTLPPTFTKFQHLTNLNLSHNKFEQLPRCLIDGMCSISTLDLSHNQLLDISMKPFCIQQLVSLNISNNTKLCSLPRWLWSIECNLLKSLDVSFTNCFDNIETDPYLNMYGISKHLENMNASNTNCDVLKLEFIKHLKNLKTLILDNYGTVMKKNHNYFSKMPLVFNYRFKVITSLSLSNVDLSDFGKHVYFSLPNLRVLNLSDNSIISLPESFGQLTNLEDCNLSKNQIVEIPECFKNLKKLKKLVFNNNWLSKFPKILDHLLNLKFLDLYANKLVVCPSWNSDCTIESLDLEQNIFSTLINIDQNIKENYSSLLKNLRLSINESRETGPLFSEDSDDSESSNGREGSSKSWSHYSSEYSNDGEGQEDTKEYNVSPEEFWDYNTYEVTTDLFDPKDFELRLIEELKTPVKALTSDEEAKEKKSFSSVVRFTNEHYFRPSDEHHSKKF